MSERIEDWAGAYFRKHLLMPELMTADRFNRYLWFAEHVCESPIEQKMLAILMACWFRNATSTPIYIAHAGTSPEEYAELWEYGAEAVIIPQCGITIGEANYRLDFEVGFSPALTPGKFVTLAIECDGHDFHERTKEQAARDRRRDRDIQNVMPILRFTGSEIYRDPGAVSLQIDKFGGDMVARCFRKRA